MRPKTLVICDYVSIYVRMSALSCIIAHLAVPFEPADTAAYTTWIGVIGVVTVRLFTATYRPNCSLYLYNHQWWKEFRRPESGHAPRTQYVLNTCFPLLGSTNAGSVAVGEDFEEVEIHWRLVGAETPTQNCP